MFNSIVSCSRFLARQFFCVACILLFAAVPCCAQFTVRIFLQSLPVTHPADSIFAAGNFNNWNPANPAFRFDQKQNIPLLKLQNVPPGTYEFKFTRGGWDKVECTADGKDIGNRQIQLTSDTVLEFSVNGWKDDFVTEPKKHTASSNVELLDTALLMAESGRYKRLWVYLPPGYTAGSRRYPVMYMHDGQNVFDDFYSGYGEWQVDETLDSLTKAGRQGCIVVGIESSDKRMTEYNPYELATFGKGEGDMYVDFICKTVKPFIDKKYRTLSAKENTIIAGSSLGGLISYYAMLKYPGTFGKAGIFSPAFWLAPSIYNATDSMGGRLTGKLFFYIGEKEGKQHVNNMINIMEKIGKNSSVMIYSIINPEGEHNEANWRKWFAEFYTFILADGFNAAAVLHD